VFTFAVDTGRVLNCASDELLSVDALSGKLQQIEDTGTSLVAVISLSYFQC